MIEDEITVEILAAKATEIIELHEKLDDTFGDTYSLNHLKIAIAAGISDAYRRGLKKETLNQN